MSDTATCETAKGDTDMFDPVVKCLHEKLQPMASPAMLTDSRRLFHGRGKFYPRLEWLTIDYHPGCILVTVFGTIQQAQTQALVAQLTAILRRFFSQPRWQTLQLSLLIQRRDQPGAPFHVILGTLPEKPYALRQGLRFSLSFEQQNIGYFLDIEPARLWLAQQASGCSVLNLFSYTCTFSVVAMQAGAASVVNFDMSGKSLQRGRDNHELNQVASSQVRYFAHDILKSWGKIKKYGPYDIVIVDPPSFQKGSFIAQKDYRKVLLKMPALVSEGGAFLACLNAPEILQQEFCTWISESCPEFVLERSLDAHPDFPEHDAGRGLKMLVYRRLAVAE